MPSSHPYQISSILQVITHFSPQSVLDVGVGFGRYGFLVADILDPERLLPNGAPSGHLKLDGIEGFEGYIGTLQRTFYDDIVIGDVREKLSGIPAGSYDLALMIDVLEHIPENDVPSILRDLRRVARTVLVSTPHAYFHQHESYGNALEEHVSHPLRADLAQAGFEAFLRDRHSLIALSSTDSRGMTTFRQALRRQRIADLLPEKLYGGFRRMRTHNSHAVV